MALQTAILQQYLAECQELVLTEIREIIPRSRFRPILYDLMLEYPLRLGKAFRPSICIATCRGLGGRLQDVLRTAAVLELYHNAFLLHDDVEDGSLMRRGEPTLHREYGAAIAINVGDGMNALCLQPLLDNMRLLGLGKALRILELVARMARESVEGQAVELDWVRRSRWELSDHDYLVMSYKKTCWYTFITPMLIGGIIAGAADGQRKVLRRYATYVGLAFQIQDDVLNLVADEGRYGKEIGGDLFEGKRTLMLLHMLRSAAPRERAEARAILERPREDKSPGDVECLFGLIRRHGSVDHAQNLARRLAIRAERCLEETRDWMPDSAHREFLAGMADYVISRDR